MSILRWLCVLVVLLGSSAPALSGYVLERDVVYDVVTEKDGDGVLRTVSLKLDLYRPTLATGRVPLLLYIHGGCYVLGSKSVVPAFIRNLTDSGIAVASIGYRLAFDPRRPQVSQSNWPYPAGLKDVQQAVRFLRRNRDRFGLDTGRIAAHGESTGGYYAAALGVRPLTDRQGRIDADATRVGIVSDWYGRTDFTLPKSPTGVSCHEFWLGKTLTAETKQEFAAAGIIPHVDRDSASRFLILHGNKDLQVDPVHSVLLAEKLRAAGINAKFYLNEGYGHNFVGAPVAEAVTRRFLLGALLGPVPEQPVSRLQINAGRTDTKDREALPGQWQTDRYMNATSPDSTILYDGCRDQAIGNAAPSLSKLYWDVRYGRQFGYRIPVANGAYRIRLHFAECRYTRIGQRRFDVRLLNIPILRNYDILKATKGKFASADVQELYIIVQSGRIGLDFTNLSGNNANINALEIERLF